MCSKPRNALNPPKFLRWPTINCLSYVSEISTDWLELANGSLHDREWGASTSLSDRTLNVGERNLERASRVGHSAESNPR
ncbi:hypothetical protein M408DRAFT_177403 [Serendipita vermifera MAFF 305830]|uniref:Uncharacterized protein n=1 Tax=Serendipita vermifera MAFF 305830 TaxID=933852 RepID=A0A0C3AQB7_SERVB|nr:hypothetical protein M408DRAFT_177403 [Serendipita vermifera MAFF 305830]